MTIGQLIGLDLLVLVIATAGWIGAAVALVAGKHLIASALAVVGALAVPARGVVVVVLADRGWWFVQEKVLTLPLIALAAIVAMVAAGPGLVRAARGATPGPPRSAVVALFAAGYTTVAAFVLTFLIGYPLSLSAALITVGLLGVAVLVTARAAGAGPWPAALPATAVFAAVAVAGAGIAFVPGPTTDEGGGTAIQQAAGRAVDTFAGADTPAAGGQVREHTLTAAKQSVTLTSGKRVDAWTYNGTLPGPALTAEKGDLIKVTLRNADIEDGVTIHWHGYDVPNREDGAPGLTQGAVLPGEEFVYRFRAEQVGTYWYHTHQVSDIGVRKGLFGTLVVTDPAAEAEDVDLVLPVHTFDGATVVGDSDTTVLRTAAPGSQVRLRLINTDDTPLRVALHGTRFTVPSVDGRALNEPGDLVRTAITLAAGSRNDLVFTMPQTPVSVVLRTATLGVQLTASDTDEATPVERTAGWPELDLLAYGRPTGEIERPATYQRDFIMVLDRALAMVDGSPMYAQTINGRGSPSVPTQMVREGDLVRMTVVNRSTEIHPWHLHGHTVKVLSRNGRVPTGSPLLMDTFDVRPGEVWQISFQADNPGIWMNHCHNLPHAEQGMRMHLSYEGVTSPHMGAGHSTGNH